jgi:hypothetical protein
MRRIPTSLSLALVVATSAPGHADDIDPPAPPALADLSWLVGHWSGPVGDGTMEELWMAPAGDLMLGLNRTVGPDGTAFEYLRIEARDDGSIVYLPAPGGEAAAPFALAELRPGYAAFANPDNDFPTLITYTLDDDGATLTATISAERDGETHALSFEWTRVDP